MVRECFIIEIDRIETIQKYFPSHDCANSRSLHLIYRYIYIFFICYHRIQNFALPRRKRKFTRIFNISGNFTRQSAQSEASRFRRRLQVR